MFRQIADFMTKNGCGQMYMGPAESAALEVYTADGIVSALAGLITAEQPDAVFLPHTYRTRDFVEVRRGNLALTKGRLIIDSEVASDDLALDVTSRWRAFPAKGAKLPQILEGASGSFAIAGNIHSKASVPIELVPGLPISGTGRLDTTLRLKDGTLQITEHPVRLAQEKKYEGKYLLQTDQTDMTAAEAVEQYRTALLLKPEDAAVPLFDTAAIHAEAAAEWALS